MKFWLQTDIRIFSVLYESKELDQSGVLKKGLTLIIYSGFIKHIFEYLILYWYFDTK